MAHAATGPSADLSTSPASSIGASNKTVVAEPFQADSLAVGLIVLLLMSVIQRCFGFLRGVGFCHYMDEESLGQWAMALCFINLITPMFLLGLPGSIVRYVEHFRRKGQLQCFVYRIASSTALLVLAVSVAMLFVPGIFANMIFRDASLVDPIYALAVAMLAIVLMNFLQNLVSGLRQVRVASLMQFVNGVGFTLLSIGWLIIGGNLSGLIITFAISALLGCLPAVYVLMRGWPHVPRSTELLSHRGFIRRVAPYAIALWMFNLIGNLFEISDRYMILHIGGVDSATGQAMVGEYFCARTLPVLLLSLAVMVSGVLMPYLSADWESGHRRRVSANLRKALLLGSGVFTFCSAMGMAMAPWIFATFLDGRYEQGLSIMPLTFVYCAWAGLVVIAQDYLWCAEKGRDVGVSLFAGLAANVVLNFWLLPLMGLSGAVVATTIANLLVLVAVLWFMHWHGFQFDSSIAIVLFLPATLLAGVTASLVALALVAFADRYARRYLIEAIDEIKQMCGRFASDGP